MIALALTSSSRASSLIRTWLASLRTLPLLLDPHRSSLPLAQPYPQRFPTAFLRSFPPFRQLYPSPQLEPRRLLPPCPWFRRARWSLRPLRRRLHRSGSRPGRSCPPFSRRCLEFPSAALG